MGLDKIKILIVEDDEKNVCNAKSVFIVFEGIVDVIYSRTLDGAFDILQCKKVDAVLSDLFFKKNNECNGGRVFSEFLNILNKEDFSKLKRYFSFTCHDSLLPLGFIVEKECKKLNIPILFVSSVGRGHGDMWDRFYGCRLIAECVRSQAWIPCEASGDWGSFITNVMRSNEYEEKKGDCWLLAFKALLFLIGSSIENTIQLNTNKYDCWKRKMASKKV